MERTNWKLLSAMYTQVNFAFTFRICFLVFFWKSWKYPWDQTYQVFFPAWTQNKNFQNHVYVVMFKLAYLSGNRLIMFTLY